MWIQSIIHTSNAVDLLDEDNRLQVSKVYSNLIDQFRVPALITRLPKDLEQTTSNVMTEVVCISYLELSLICDKTESSPFSGLHSRKIEEEKIIDKVLVLSSC